MADAATATPDVAIDGLTAEQCAQLQGVTLGTLLEVAIFTRPKAREHVDAESDEEGSDAEDENEDHGGGAAESDAVPQIAGDEPDGSDFTAAATSDRDAAIPGINKMIVEDRINGVVFDVPAGSVPGGVISTTDAVLGTPGASRANAATGDGQLAEDLTGGGADSVSDEGSEDEGGDGEENDDNDGAPEEEYSDDGEYDLPQELGRELYIVTHLAKNASLSISDIHLRRLTYQGPGEGAGHNTYRIFGDDVTLHDQSAAPVDDEELYVLSHMIDDETDNDFVFLKDPKGDRVREAIFNKVCPSGCRRGWLRDQSKLKDLVDDDLQALQPFKPVCPVCLGKDLMNEQLLLRGLMGTMHMVDLGMVVEYLGRLNPRRRLLGYPFVQFDEREWGYGFDDMLDESGSEEDDDDAAQYEQWDEAMDPNANPKTRPASKATIASLPRKRYEDVIKKEKGDFCAICQQDPFFEDSMVVELPCGHVYDDGCLEAWIGQFDNCPQCRAIVSGMVEVKPGAEVSGGEAAAGAVNGDTGKQVASLDKAGEEMDGDDVVMSDAG